MNKKITEIIFALALVLTSCGIPKETLQRIESGKKEPVDLPLDYANLFPTPTYEQWDKDYNSYDRFLTKDVMRTQVGLSFKNNDVQTWWCMPSARTHVQLDTATMITDSKAIMGDWRVCCNRKIAYKDSAVYADRKIYRDVKLIRNETDADAFLSITDTKFNLYGADKAGNNFKRVASKNYSIESKRFLMLYGASKASAAISFIGIDKEGRLIINSYIVQERKIEGIYITYEAIMVQMIYKRAA